MTKVLGIFIGSGGSGAKVAQAMVHATAAGLGPDRLLVGLVDQDGGNGNTSNAVAAVKAYAKARRAFRTPESAHRLGNDSRLLMPEIDLISVDDEMWVPYPDGATTLDRAVGERNAADAALFDALFEIGESEQQMPFEIGYRARPNVGALAMALAMQTRAPPFVKAVRDAIAQAAQGWSVRLIIAGSIFGGTGAAGLPTLARLLKKAVPPQFAGDFRMGGVLMLPYFSFDEPTEDEAKSFASPNQFLPSSRAALAYYHGLRTREQLPFDQAYLVGWDPLFVAPGFNPGGGGQSNPPMPPELVAALGACLFCHSAPTITEAVALTTRAETASLGWTDLPSPDADPLSAFHGIGHMLRFAIAWQYWNGVAGEEGARKFSLMRRRPVFYGKQGLDKIDWKRSPPQAEREALNAWTSDILEWARSMANVVSTNKLDFRLWRAPPTVAALADTPVFRDSYDAILHSPESAAAVTGATALNEMLNNVAGPAQATGLARFAARLFDGSATR